MRPHLVHWLDAVLPGRVASMLAPTWFTCVGLAGVVTLFVMLAVARRHRIETSVAASIVLWCYLAAVSAGIVVPMALDAAGQLLTTGRLRLHWAGMTSFWGYLAGAAAVVVACRRNRVPLARFADLTAAPLGLALVLARLGCFLAGCDYGKVTSLPWAMRFPAGSPAWHDHVAAGLLAADRPASLPVHPTQLYEAALGVVIAMVALAVAHLRPTPVQAASTRSASMRSASTRSAPARSAHRADGSLFLLAAAMYAVGRIAIEAVRGDSGRGIYLGLSSGQIFSLALLAIIAGGFALGRRSRRTRIRDASAAHEPRRASKVIAAAATILLIGIVDRHTAHAQPAPGASPSNSASSTATPASPVAAPAAQPTYDPGARPPARAAATGPAASTEGSGRSSIHIGALVGLATPFNRRSDQVATLGGPSLSLGLVMSRFGIWLDLDSLGNRDASHGTVLLSGGVLLPVANHLHVGGRVGLGATLVNFDDPAFRDVAGTALRFEALAEYSVSDAWAVWLRPLSFDVLTASDLGGPIATWQTRIGLGYQFGTRRRTAPTAPQQPAYPPQQPYPPQRDPSQGAPRSR